MKHNIFEVFIGSTGLYVVIIFLLRKFYAGDKMCFVIGLLSFLLLWMAYNGMIKLVRKINQLQKESK